MPCDVAAESSSTSDLPSGRLASFLSRAVHALSRLDLVLCRPALSARRAAADLRLSELCWSGLFRAAPCAGQSARKELSASSEPRRDAMGRAEPTTCRADLRRSAAPRPRHAGSRCQRSRQKKSSRINKLLKVRLRGSRP